MKIAYVTVYDSSDLDNWSGLGTHIRAALSDSGFEVAPIGGLRQPFAFPYKVKALAYAGLLGKRYLRDREPGILRHYADQVETALASMSCDVVFCPGTSPITYLRTPKPIVVWLDSVFAGGVDFYPYYSNLCAETIRKGNLTTQAALSNCRLVILGSDWAAESVVRNYAVDPKIVKVVPFGPGVACNRNREDIRSIVESKSFDICKLLFVGVDWVRKGGDLAVKVAELLIRRGLETELHVVGCIPPRNSPPFVKQHGFVSKKSREGRILFDRLMAESHFFIMPSRAEMYGLVFPEASSFGLPSLATRVGGIPTAVRDGLNGQTFPLDAGPEPYCDFIARLMGSREQYAQLALSSFKEYSERLNWASSGRKVHELIREFCG